MDKLPWVGDVSSLGDSKLPCFISCGGVNIVLLDVSLWSSLTALSGSFWPEWWLLALKCDCNFLSPLCFFKSVLFLLFLCFVLRFSGSHFPLCLLRMWTACPGCSDGGDLEALFSYMAFICSCFCSMCSMYSWYSGHG